MKVAVVIAACSGLAACGDNLEAPRPDIAEASPATETVDVEVPSGMDSAPFDVPRTLVVPPGFGVRVIARVPTARFLAETPEGDILVSDPGGLANADGQIMRISRSSHAVTTIVSGLTLCHDMVFKNIDGVEYLYISEHARITRTVWDPHRATLGDLEPVVDNLPSASLAELHGNYGHALKNIAVSDDTLFVSIASATNSDPSDQLADPVRGAIYAYPLAGGTGRLYAKGLRNAEGLAFHPKTGELWAAVNNRDNTMYPYHDGVYPFDKLVSAYVNDNPPEPFTRIRDGANYGWPYCNPTARSPTDARAYTVFSDMPYINDIDNNDGETVLDCGSLDPIAKGLPAHAAPLGMSFWTGDNSPTGYRDGAVIGEHGCWNCTRAHGYEVVYLKPHQADDSFDDSVPLVTGFLPDPDADPTVRDEAWGRPVDVIPNREGDLYISDDRAGAVYELYRR